MRLSIYLLLITTFSLSARGFSQNDIVSVDVKNANLSSIIKEIRKVSDYRFLFRVEEVNKYGKRDFKVKKANMENVMQELLKGTLLSYSVDNGIIIIKPQSTKDKNKKVTKKRIKGRVLDKNGKALPGVSVVIKGTHLGVSTDVNGSFSIELLEVTKNTALIFSFIGMETKELKVIVGKEMKVTLLDKKAKLDEVVVTGYTKIKKEHFTGNSVQVSKKELMKTNTKSVISALQVFDPSFRIKESNKWGSDPNAMPEFNLRGESSIGMDKGLAVEDMKRNQRTNLKGNPNLPLFILDGFEVSVQKICDMDINRIENINILKDAAATALYGSRAANGVILITTKAPKPGDLRVTYNLELSCQLPDLSDYNLCNAAEKLETERLAGVYSSPDDPGFQMYQDWDYNNKLLLVQRGVNTDWMAQPLRNAYNHKHTITLEGGVNNLRYGADIRYDSNKGVMKGSYRSRTSAGLFLDYRYKKFQLKNHITFTKASSMDSPYGSFSTYTTTNPYNPIYGDDGKMLKFFDEQNTYSNPLYKTLLKSYSGKGNIEEFQNNMNVSYKFNQNLEFRSDFSITKIINKDENFIDPLDPSFERKETKEKGQLSKRYGEDFSWNLNALMTYNKSVGKHIINMTTGINASENKSNSNLSVLQGFQVGNLISPEYAAQQKDKLAVTESTRKLIGFIANLNYSYKNIYLFDASFRLDGSSQFGSEKKYAPFWSVGTGLNIHNYEFLKDNPVISRLKIRGSYGSLGKVNFPSYTAIDTYETDIESWYYTGSAYYLVGLGNPKLKWETTKTFDTGFEVAFLNGKIYLSASYYNKKTVDLIDDMFLRYSTGFSQCKINSGKIENKGYEANFRATVLRTKDIMFVVNANISRNENRILELGKSAKEYNESIQKNYDAEWPQYGNLVSVPLQQYNVGESTTAIYAVRSAGIDPSNGKEKFIKKNGMSTYTWCSDDQVVVGDRTPDARGAFGFNLQYKNFYINTSFLYEWGAQFDNSTLRNKVEIVNIDRDNVDKRVLSDRWKNAGDLAGFYDLRAFKKRDYRPSTRFIQNNNYIEFNSLSLGYDFDAKVVKKMGLERLGVRLNLNNLGRISTIKTERGTSYPFARNYSFTLTTAF